MAAVSLLVLFTGAMADVVNIDPQRDNTLFEIDDGSLSNGIGSGLFSGATSSGDLRRALISFDIAGNVPAGATVTAVQLQMNVSQRSSVTPSTAALHRVTTNWGEGTSNSTVRGGGQGAPATPNDATWKHALFNTVDWTTLGGDFVAKESASQSITGLDAVVWGSTSQMIADVQSWLDDPQNNFGWMIRIDELTLRSAKRFDSREHLSIADRPVLVVTFDGTAVEAATWTSIKTLLR